MRFIPSAVTTRRRGNGGKRLSVVLLCVSALPSPTGRTELAGLQPRADGSSPSQSLIDLDLGFGLDFVVAKRSFDVRILWQQVSVVSFDHFDPVSQPLGDLENRDAGDGQEAGKRMPHHVRLDPG